jgi:hypothetical protein
MGGLKKLLFASRRSRLRASTIVSALALLSALASPGVTTGASPAVPVAATHAVSPGGHVVAAALGVFDALPDHGAVMDSVGVFPFSRCVAPPDARSWTVIVNFAQGANSRVSSENLVVDAAGNWGGYFTIPVGAAPGPAQLTASCFDPSHTSATTFDYSPLPFTVLASALTATPAAAPVGGSISVSAGGVCPAPAGATSWISIVHFAQGANPAISFRIYAVDGTGHWGGSLTIPYGAVAGPAQLTASCFDAAHASAVTVDYQPVPFTVTVPTFTATPASNAVGSVISVAGDSPCPTPPGATAWTAIVSFGQGANSQVAFRNYGVDGAGNWGGTFTVPAAARVGAAQLTASCFDAAHASPTELDYAPRAFTVTLHTTPTVLAPILMLLLN